MSITQCVHLIFLPSLPIRADHIPQLELGVPLPKVPTVFFKPPHALAHPNQSVLIPHVAQNEEMDYEVELAIILSRDTKNVSEEEAMNNVLGYTVANDLTARKHWKMASQWGYCKGEPNSARVKPRLLR